MAWENELQSLESAVLRLNAEYDAFLYGSALKPPVDSRKTVEKIFRHLSAQETDSAADRYRLTTLQGRFNTLCERWDRLQTEKELGKRPGVYGGFARESRRAPAAPRSELPSRPAPVAPNAAASPSVDRGSAAADRDAELFDRYLAARTSQGEDVRGYDLARFRESLQREREKLKEHFGAAEVDFDVAQRDGRVKLVARKRSAPPGGTGGEGKS